MHMLLFPTTLVGLLATAARAESFLSSCPNPTIDPSGAEMYAFCKENGGDTPTPQVRKLRIGECLGNSDNGNMEVRQQYAPPQPPNPPTASYAAIANKCIRPNGTNGLSVSP